VDAVNGGEPQFITDRLGLYSLDRTLIAYPESGQTYIERLGVERWVAPSEGRAVSFSPDGALIVWQAAAVSGSFDQRLVEVWVANVDGSEARAVTRLVGGGFSGWFPDSTRLLVTGREADGEEQWFLGALTAADGTLTKIVQGPRLRGGALSPDGAWVAYQILFSRDSARDGVWVARTDGSESWRLEVFGAYRWRSADHLLLVPLETNAEGQHFIEIEMRTGRVRPLTDPAFTPLYIAGGDWALSPDRNRVAFVSAEDHNLWVVDLP